MKSTVNSLNKMTHDLGKIADDFEDEFDTMTNDLRQKSDRVYDTFEQPEISWTATGIR